MRVDAKKVIGAERSPAADGARLGSHLVAAMSQTPVTVLVIDVSDLAPEDLVSTFVNTALQSIADHLSGRTWPEIRWVAAYESERQRMEFLTSCFHEMSPRRARC